MFDLATAKTRLNITGTAQDTQILAALNAALAIAENYCDRRFLYKRDTIAFYDVDAHALILSRYPIDTVNFITSKQTGNAIAPDTYHIHKWNGMIYFHGAPFFDEIQIDYTGGYLTLPADLELALWLAFDAVWPTLSGQGAAAVGGGAVKAIRSNGASIEYDTSGGGGAGLASSGNGGLPIGAIGILDLYRRTTC